MHVLFRHQHFFFARPYLLFKCRHGIVYQGVAFAVKLRVKRGRIVGARGGLGLFGVDVALRLFNHVQHARQLLGRPAGGLFGAAQSLQFVFCLIEFGSVALYVVHEFSQRLFSVGDVVFRLSFFFFDAYEIFHLRLHAVLLRPGVGKSARNGIPRVAQHGKIAFQQTNLFFHILPLGAMLAQLCKPAGDLVLLVRYMPVQDVRVVGGGLVILHSECLADYILPPGALQDGLYLLLGRIHRITVYPAVRTGVGRLPEVQYLQNAGL